MEAFWKFCYINWKKIIQTNTYTPLFNIFAGHRCDIDIDDCASDPCQNKGTCTDLVNGYNCTCTDEWMGETCVIQYDACTPELQNCKNNATCTTTPPSRDFHCECVPGFSGSDCGQNIDDCAQHNCTYPEICYDVINGFYCACPIGECMAGFIAFEETPFCQRKISTVFDLISTYTVLSLSLLVVTFTNSLDPDQDRHFDVC